MFLNKPVVYVSNLISMCQFRGDVEDAGNFNKVGDIIHCFNDEKVN